MAGIAQTDSPSELPSNSHDDAPGHDKRLFVIVAVIVGLWWCVMIVMAVFTTSFVTLNRRQIAKSVYVVTAEVVDAKKGRLKVLKEWKSGKLLGELSLPALEKQSRVAGGGALANGTTYIIPLAISASDSLRVTPTAEDETGTIYPANERTIEQLREIVLKSSGG